MGEVGTPTSTAAGMPQAPEGEGWAPTNVLARCISDPASFSFMMTVISVVMVVALMMMMVLILIIVMITIMSVIMIVAMTMMPAGHVHAQHERRRHHHRHHGNCGFASAHQPVQCSSTRATLEML